MASKRERQNGTWEYVFKRKGVLPSPVYFTFDTEAQGDAYAARAEAMLAKGVVPVEMLSERVKTLGDLCELYGASVPMVDSEAELLPTLQRLVQSVRIENLSYSWVEGMVNDLKAAGKAPSTISKRVGGLARVVDWAMRRNMVTLDSNPLRMLPRGYCSAKVDRNKTWEGERSRRLEPGEEAAIRKVLTDPWELLLFDMALETAMRLSELFTLRCDQIDLDQRTIFLHKTKNGSRRQVPISSVLMKRLQGQDLTQGYLFHVWWQGGGDTCRNLISKRLSHAFARRFAKAKVGNFRFHDLRHEATSRIYERTKLTDLQVASITGHKGFRMLQRYANLRGSTLAEAMW
jgi:integrase